MRKCPFCDIEVSEEILQCAHCGRWLDHSATSQREFSAVGTKESPKDSGMDMCDEGGICSDDD